MESGRITSLVNMENYSEKVKGKKSLHFLVFMGAIFFLLATLIYFKTKENESIQTSQENYPEIPNPPKDPYKELTGGISILNFGDIMLDRGVRNAITKGREPFEHIEEIKNAFLEEKIDFVVGNLEGPIIETERENCQKKAYNFQFSKSTGERLKKAGVSLVNLANNHIFDCYLEGVRATENNLDDFGIEYFGGRTIEKSHISKQIGEKNIAFLGIDETVQPIPLHDFYPLVGKLKEENDYVVVNIHWGIEYQKQHSKNQEQIAHSLIDSGADIIFGHHPHVIESVEVYKGKAIFYSLGNFVFDQLEAETNQGIAGGVILGQNKTEVHIIPYKIISTQPKLLSPEETAIFCDEYLGSIPNKNNCSFEIFN